MSDEEGRRETPVELKREASRSPGPDTIDVKIKSVQKSVRSHWVPWGPHVIRGIPPFLPSLQISFLFHRR